MKYPLIVNDYQNNRVPDLFTKVEGYHMVSEVFKDLIESIDPGVHHFWPVKLIRGDEVLEGYYYMQVGRIINFDGHDPEVSGVRSLRAFKANAAKNLDLYRDITQFPVFNIIKACMGMSVNRNTLDMILDEKFYGIWEKGSSEEKRFGESIEKIM